MAGWLEGAKGVERQYHEIDIATRDAAMREMLFAMCEGHTAAIRRLAEEIEKHGC